MIAGKLETHLYLSAASKEEYANLATLIERLQKIAQEIPYQRKRQKMQSEDLEMNNSEAPTAHENQNLDEIVSNSNPFYRSKD